MRLPCAHESPARPNSPPATAPGLPYDAVMPIDPADHELIDQVRHQLGRAPWRLVGVAVACPAGHPAVVLTYPLQRHRGQWMPFPTTHWLTCQRLVKAVSRLERGGGIRRAADWLQAQPDRLSAMHLAHEQAIDIRWALLEQSDRERVHEHGLTQAICHRGIGGTRNFDAVKCLHAHFAFHLAHPTVLGAWIESQAELQLCENRHSDSGEAVEVVPPEPYTTGPLP